MSSPSSLLSWSVAACLAFCTGCAGSIQLRSVERTNRFNAPVEPYDVVSGRPNVAVVVHGWTSDPEIAFREGAAPWNNPGLRTAFDRLLESRGTTQDWDLWGLDWRQGAAVPEGSNAKAMPCTANEINAQVQGQWIAKTLLSHHEYRHVHLIGHSLGGRVIETASVMLRQVMPEAQIHTTFLDAYSAYTWDRVYGSTADFADHYYNTGDWIVRMTNEDFPSALNVDVSAIAPPYDENWEWGEQSWGHNAPVWFYRDSILDPGLERFHGYGISLGREVLGDDWPATTPDYGVTQLATLTLAEGVTRVRVPRAVDVPGSAFRVVTPPESLVDRFGAVDATEERVELSASSGASVSWVVFEFETTAETNFAELEFHWTEPEGAARMMFLVDGEALWATESQASLGRWLSTGRIMWTGMFVRIPTEATLDAGTHELAFRLDLFDGERAAVQVRGLRGGMLETEKPASE